MFDLGIIGGGPAGYSAASEAVRRQMSVVLFEKGDMGGTCLNRGCVPTKYLAHIAHKNYEAKTAGAYGLSFSSAAPDYSMTKRQMDGMVSSMRRELADSLKKAGITVVIGDAVIKEPGLIGCMGQEYGVRNILICTGSEPAPAVVSGAKSSDDILSMEAVPDKILIIGGGTIAVEFAWIFRMLGSDVELFLRGDRILRAWDKEIASGMAQSMKKNGIRINRNCDFASFSMPQDAVILSANGRRPVLPASEKALYDTGENGGITVDKNGQTKTKGIFAAGDVTEKSSMLAHTAMEEGRRIVQYISDGIPYEKPAVVRCIYGDQEAASVGLTEREAEEQGIEAVSAKQTMFSNARTVISAGGRGFIKIVAAKSDRRIIGAQLLCGRAGEIVAELALAVNQKITVDALLRSVRPHPSYCEAVGDALRALEDKLDGL